MTVQALWYLVAGLAAVTVTCLAVLAVTRAELAALRRRVDEIERGGGPTLVALDDLLGTAEEHW